MTSSVNFHFIFSQIRLCHNHGKLADHKCICTPLFAGSDCRVPLSKYDVIALNVHHVYLFFESFAFAKNVTKPENEVIL